MPNRIKQFFAGVMIAGDVFLMAFALSMLGTYDAGIGIFMLIFLAVDAYLSVDYILNLHRQNAAIADQEVEENMAAIRQEAEDDRLEREKEQQEQELEKKRAELDDALAAEVREEKDDTLDELKKSLTRDPSDQMTQTK
jgi:regulatory protein YycI of two-component signal transduction system YycFG